MFVLLAMMYGCVCLSSRRYSDSLVLGDEYERSDGIVVMLSNFLRF